MKLGAVQHVFSRTDGDLAKFEKAKVFGFDGIEPDLDVADLADASEARLASLAAARDATGLPVTSLCIGAHNHAGFVSAPWRGGQPVEEIRRAVRWCHALGAKVLLVPFFGANEPKNVLQRQFVADTFRPICQEAESLGVSVCYEGTLPATQLWQVVARVDSPAFGVYFDMSNALWVELDPAAEIRALGRLIRAVHIKDAKLGTGDARIGTGRVDFAACARALADIGYDDWMTIEAFGIDDAAIASDIAATRRLFPIR